MSSQAGLTVERRTREREGGRERSAIQRLSAAATTTVVVVVVCRACVCHNKRLEASSAAATAAFSRDQVPLDAGPSHSHYSGERRGDCTSETNSRSKVPTRTSQAAATTTTATGSGACSFSVCVCFPAELVAMPKPSSCPGCRPERRPGNFTSFFPPLDPICVTREGVTRSDLAASAAADDFHLLSQPSRRSCEIAVCSEEKDPTREGGWDGRGKILSEERGSQAGRRERKGDVGSVRCNTHSHDNIAVLLSVTHLITASGCSFAPLARELLLLAPPAAAARSSAPGAGCRWQQQAPAGDEEEDGGVAGT